MSGATASIRVYIGRFSVPRAGRRPVAAGVGVVRDPPTTDLELRPSDNLVA